MKNFLETPRLILRPFKKEDLKFLKKLWKDPEVMHFSLKGPLSDEEIKKLFKKTLENQKKYGFGACSVICKKTKEWLGFCGLWREFEGKKVLDFGYRFFKKFWGQGYATEAVIACVDYLREKYPNEKIYSYISPKNLASVRVAEKSGMKFIKENIYKDLKVLKYRI